MHLGKVLTQNQTYNKKKYVLQECSLPDPPRCMLYCFYFLSTIHTPTDSVHVTADTLTKKKISRITTTVKMFSMFRFVSVSYL